MAQSAQLSDRFVPAPILASIAGAAAVVAGTNRPKTKRLLSRAGPRSPWQLDLLQRQLFDAAEVLALMGAPPIVARPAYGTSEPGTPLVEMVCAEVEFYVRSRLLPDADAFSMVDFDRITRSLRGSKVFSRCSRGNRLSNWLPREVGPSRIAKE
jgi:hypothetical protein